MRISSACIEPDSTGLVGEDQHRLEPITPAARGREEFEVSPGLAHDLFDNRQAETSPRRTLTTRTLEAAFQLRELIRANGRPID